MARTESPAATWLDEHGDVLYRFALARVGDFETAADLVQDTLLEAIRCFDAYTGRSASAHLAHWNPEAQSHRHAQASLPRA